MTRRAIENRIKKLKELEEQKKALEQEIDSLKEEIKKDLEAKGTEELQVGIFIIRFTSVLSGLIRSGSRSSTETFITSLPSRQPAGGSRFHRGRKASMNYSTLTVEDCIRKQEQEGMATVIENGAVTGFVKE